MFYHQNHTFPKKNDSIAIGTKFEDFLVCTRRAARLGATFPQKFSFRKNLLMIKSLNFKRCPKLAKSKKSLSERTWFLTEELLKSHNEKVHEQVWECPHENCQFKTKGLKSALTNHIRNCHAGKRSQ